MKKIFALVLAAAVLCLAAGVRAESISAAEQTERTALFATMEEAEEAGVETLYSMWTETQYIAVGMYGDIPLRLVAECGGDVVRQADAMFSSVEYEEYLLKEWELVRSLPLAYTEDLIDGMMSRQEMDAMVGKTLRELTEEGFEIMGHGFWEEDGDVTFTLALGLFEYECVTDASTAVYLERSETNDFDDFTVMSVEIGRPSANALDLQWHADGTYVPEETGYADYGGDPMNGLMQFFSGLLAASQGDQQEDGASIPDGLTEGLPEGSEEAQGLLDWFGGLLEGGEEDGASILDGLSEALPEGSEEAQGLLDWFGGLLGN